MKHSLFNRDDFPIFSHTAARWCYLDSAATTLKPKAVIKAMDSYYEEQGSTVHRALYQKSLHTTSLYEKVREKAQKFVNAKQREEIIFTKGTTDALNLLGAGFREILQKGDHILVSAMEHHANLVPWQMCAQRASLDLSIIPITEKGEICLKTLSSAITPKTKILAITLMSNLLGTVNPIQEICSIAHKKGVTVIVDAAQGAMHTSIDVQAMDVDALAFSSHKILGPTGCGILYAKRELLEKLPPYQGGGDMVQDVTYSSFTPMPPPLKFEAGTPPIASILGLGAALDYLESYPLQKRIAYEEKLLEKLMQGLQRIERIKILGASSSRQAIVSFYSPSLHSNDIATILDLQGIEIRSGHFCAKPLVHSLGTSSACRISLAPYNQEEEMDYFLEKLRDLFRKY